jgi:PAS domain S-box-containing protein
MYGYSSKEMLALRTLDLIFEVEHDKYFVRFQRMLSSGKVAGEGQGRRKDGTIVEVEFRSVANIEPGVHFTVVRDITERKRADQELHLQKGRLQALFDQAQDGIVLVDDEGRYIDANPAACEMYGYTHDELRARAIWDLALPAGTQADRERFRRLRETGHESGEARRVRRDGTVIELEYRSVSNIEPGVHLTVMRDVTKRNRDEASLRRLSGRLLRLQDEERRRLARELHDSTAQSLAALALELAIVGERGEGLAPRARQALAEAEKIADQVSGELRTLSYLLHPPLLDEMGLTSALNAYVEGFSKRSGVEVELVMPPDIGRLSREDETTLFRIVQECLTNVHRHSMSPTARVRLALEADAIRLEVSDQGRGLAPRGAGDGGERHELGVGIAGMKERVHQLGGDLELDSSADGLTVRAFLPRRQP